MGRSFSQRLADVLAHNRTSSSSWYPSFWSFHISKIPKCSTIVGWHSSFQFKSNRLSILIAKSTINSTDISEVRAAAPIVFSCWGAVVLFFHLLAYSLVLEILDAHSLYIGVFHGQEVLHRCVKYCTISLYSSSLGVKCCLVCLKVPLLIITSFRCFLSTFHHIIIHLHLEVCKMPAASFGVYDFCQLGNY